MQSKQSEAQTSTLSGVITERNFAEAEREFPGITGFYRRCAQKPRTFLELVWAFLGLRSRAQR